MKSYFILGALIVCVSYACNSNSGKSYSVRTAIYGIKIRGLFPLIDNNGKLHGYQSQKAEVYYSGDQVLYRSFYTFNTNAKDGSLLSTEERVHYFVCKKGNKYGYFTDSTLAIFNQRALADSVMNKEWYNSGLLDAQFKPQNIVLISSQKDTSLGILKEQYSFRIKEDTTLNGTIYLEFTEKLKDVDYSLSKKLDSTKGMKLYKIKIVNNSRYLKPYNITVDAAEQNREIEKLSEFNSDKLANIFKLARKRISLINYLF